MLWILALHLISMVTWFAALFYLPRLYVYHSLTTDQTGLQRFQLMERKLYYGIMMPGGVLTTLFGLWLIVLNPDLYLKAGWMHVKLVLVTGLWVFHVYCGYLRRSFQLGQNKHSHVFYRWLNEIPTVILITVVILAVVKPF